MQMDKWIELFTDGACKGNPGPGGWGVLQHCDGKDQEFFGGELQTTNNRMELMAVIKGLETQPDHSLVRIMTDSTYVQQGITQWIKQWQKNGWRTRNNQPVKNRDLWERLHELVGLKQQVEWVWVRGHNGHAGNERADQLANKGIASIGNKGYNKDVGDTPTPPTTDKVKLETAPTIGGMGCPHISRLTQTASTCGLGKSGMFGTHPHPQPPSEVARVAGLVTPSKTVKTRQIVLDTETTGLSHKDGHRIIEIGAIELLDRCFTNHNFHQYLQPDREIDAEATNVHGITNARLIGKPRFAEIAEQLIAYVRGAELIIHNAQFDVGFLNAEFSRWSAITGGPTISIEDICPITDTLAMARKIYPGQRNSLDFLCKRCGIDQSKRTLHGALLDAELLARVYLAMTGGQVSLSLDSSVSGNSKSSPSAKARIADENRKALVVVRASTAEMALHQARLESIDKSSGGHCLWLMQPGDVGDTARPQKFPTPA